MRFTPTPFASAVALLLSGALAPACALYGAGSF